MKTVFKAGVCVQMLVTLLTAAGLGPARQARAEAVDTLRWGMSMDIRLSGYQGASSLTGFPALVSFNPATISGFSYSAFQPQGTDLRFTDADNAVLLSHEIEAWDIGGAEQLGGLRATSCDERDDDRVYL